MTNRAVGTFRQRVAAIKPDIKIAINTLPFFQTDFENVAEQVFGQSPSRLREVADVFEVMGYHQILARDSSWPAAIAADVKRRSRSTTVCTIQGSALYLEGMHANRGRRLAITTDEFIDVVDRIEATDVDGVCVFTFTDFLEMQGSADGQRRIDRLKNFRK